MFCVFAGVYGSDYNLPLALVCTAKDPPGSLITNWSMKVIATIFLLAGTFSPSLADVTGENGLRSLRGSENAGNDHGGAAGAGGGRVLKEDTVGTYLLVRLAKFQGTRVAWADSVRCGARAVALRSSPGTPRLVLRRLSIATPQFGWPAADSVLVSLSRRLGPVLCRPRAEQGRALFCICIH